MIVLIAIIIGICIVLPLVLSVNDCTNALDAHFKVKRLNQIDEPNAKEVDPKIAKIIEFLDFIDCYAGRATYYYGSTMMWQLRCAEKQINNSAVENREELIGRINAARLKVRKFTLGMF